LDRGANIEAEDNKGQTALTRASESAKQAEVDGLDFFNDLIEVVVKLLSNTVKRP